MSENKVMDYIPAAPCLKCGSGDIEIKVFEDGLIHPPQGGGKCNQCGHKSWGTIKHDEEDGPIEVWWPECVERWNHGNDLEAIMKRLDKEIMALTSELASYRRLKNCAGRGIPWA